MKIKSLLLLGLMTICSMSAFADDVFVKDGVRYLALTANIDASKKTAKVTVQDIFNNTKGVAIQKAKAVTIPATVTVNKDDEEWTLTVTGFESGWTNKGLAESLNCSTMTTLTVDNSISMTNAIAAAIVNLNITGEIKTDFTPTANTAITALDLSGLTGSKKLTVPAGFTALKTIKLPSAVNTVIAANAFKNNTNFEGIDLANVSEIGANAFDGCSNAKFKTLTIPGNIAKGKIGAAAFANMTNLESVTITNNNLEKIDAWFANDTKIKAISITSTSINEIAANAFSGISADYKTLDLTGCSKLKTVATTSFKTNAYEKLLLKGTAIDDANFAKVLSWLTGATASLKEITFPDGITTIPAMGALTAMESVGLPKNLTTIGNNAFKGWAALKAIKIKSHVTSIGNNAFDGCTVLFKVDFSEANALTSIGANAFANCPALLTLDLSGATKLATIAATSFPANAYTSVLLSGTALDDANFAKFNFSGATASLAEVTLPAGITTIPANKFQNFAKLETVALPKNVTTIGANAFDGSALTSIKIREKVTTINPFAFANCANLATVNFSEAAELTTIGAGAFNNDPKLLAIDLSGATKLANIVATSFPANAYTSVLLSGTALDDANFAKFNFTGAVASLKEVTLPAGITTIPANKFQNFSALTSVSIPKAVTSIGNFAFENSALTAVKIRENVTSIGAAAFANCADLAVVNFTEATALTTIGGSAFRNTAIKEAILPANVTTMVGGFQFADNVKLKSFSAKGLVGDLPNNILQNCVKLTGIVIPKGATGIGASAFEGCSTLATVTFKFEEGDDALATNGIGARAFKDCEALAALDLSATLLTNLNNANIFQGCTALAEITFPETLISLNSADLFADCPIENLDASKVTWSANLFGKYWNGTTYVARDADNANTTLKTVKIGGLVPMNCFAYCTALESVEYFDRHETAGWGTLASDVRWNAFEHCTGLKTFTYEPTEPAQAMVVDNDAFHGCIPFVKIVTNSNYMDWVIATNGGLAPLNATFGDAEITTVKTVQDKKNANQFFAKFINRSYGVRFNAEDCKVFTAYVDGETVYYQACRLRDGYYNIPANRPVIIKTSEAKEVSYEIVAGPMASSIGFNDMVDSREGDDLAAVQDRAGVVAGKYLYRLTNTADQGFGFTFFNSTTIKADQFFIACEKKPAGAGRLNEVWVDEDGNVIEGNATGIEAINEDAELNGEVYNLQGVRVENPVKGGIYIKNGKKFIVK